MQVSATSGSLPLGTKVIIRTGESVTNPNSSVPSFTPEQINTAVDKAGSSVQSVQSAQAELQATQRAAAAKIYSANTQQRQLETYMTVASGGVIESEESNISTGIDIIESVQRHQKAVAIDSASNAVQSKPNYSDPALYVSV